MRVAFHYVTYSLYLVGCTLKGQQQTGRSARQQLSAVRGSQGERSPVALRSNIVATEAVESMFTWCWSCVHINCTALMEASLSPPSVSRCPAVVQVAPYWSI